MTFAVVSLAENPKKVVGTIWAAAEVEAQVMAATLFPDAYSRDRHVLVRRDEDREIPLRVLMN